MAQRRAAGDYGPDPAQFGPGSLHPNSHSSLADTAPVDFGNVLTAVLDLHARGYLREPDFKSGAPLIGPLIVTIRRFWNWMSTKWYLRPILEQQSAVNVQASQFIKDLLLSREMDALCIRQLEAQVAALQTRLSDLERNSQP